MLICVCVCVCVCARMHVCVCASVLCGGSEVIDSSDRDRPSSGRVAPSRSDTAGQRPATDKQTTSKFSVCVCVCVCVCLYISDIQLMI